MRNGGFWFYKKNLWEEMKIQIHLKYLQDELVIEYYVSTIICIVHRIYSDDLNFSIYK